MPCHFAASHFLLLQLMGRAVAQTAGVPSRALRPNVVILPTDTGG